MLKAYLYLKLIDVKSALMLKGTDIQKSSTSISFRYKYRSAFRIFDRTAHDK